MVEECRILVMASGKGSNFQALCDAIASDQIPDCRITRLIVNRQKAPAIEIAKQTSIPWEYFNLITHGFQTKSENDPGRLLEARHAYDTALARKILDGNPRPHLIILAGWMYVFGEQFLDPLLAEGIKIINLHPALLGRYAGAYAIERAFEDFQAGKLENNRTGIMVHHVIKEADQGRVIMAREVECYQGDSLEQLKERIHDHEHTLIVEATACIVREILGGGERLL